MQKQQFEIFEDKRIKYSSEEKIRIVVEGFQGGKYGCRTMPPQGNRAERVAHLFLVQISVEHLGG